MPRAASKAYSKGNNSFAPLPRSAPLFNETIHHRVFFKLSAWFRVKDSAITLGDPSVSEGKGRGTDCFPEQHCTPEPLTSAILGAARYLMPPTAWLVPERRLLLCHVTQGFLSRDD